MQDFAFKPAHEIADAVRRRAVSPVETVEAALAAMAATEPRLHAFATPAPEQALADARALEQSLARGGAAGLLAGVPVAIKDLLFTKGLRTTFGSRLYADFVPDDDDIVVERLKAAGAIVIGKTNVAEFGYSAVGHNPLLPTTCNPWNLAVTPGGSSAGSAAAVAAGVCPLAVGSDGGGSVRLPAAFTGLFGIKASMGRVPVWPGCRDPAWPGASGWESIEHIGPMARSVADAALMLQVMAGPDARDRWSLPADGTDWRDVARPVDRLGLRIAYCPQWEDVAVDPEVRALVDAAVAVFETLGCRSRRSTRRCAAWWLPAAPSSRSKATSRGCASWRPGARPACPGRCAACCRRTGSGGNSPTRSPSASAASRRCAASWNATISC